jgi:anti-sigma factor ChrR (cupin superfamily)
MNKKAEIFLLTDMIKGWFVGNFEPTVFRTNDVEVGVKNYQPGEYEKSHHHRIATEITVIQKGIVEMNGVQYGDGSIIKLDPYVSTDFRAVTDVTTIVVKIPGASDDKYFD